MSANSPQTTYLTSSGTLYVSIVDALDLVDQSKSKAPKTWMRKVKAITFAHAIITMLDETEQSELSGCGKVCTANVLYRPSEIFRIGEDFAFEKLPSSAVLFIALYTVDWSANIVQQASAPAKCIGHLKLPISRLEDNNIVSGGSRLLSLLFRFLTI